MAVQTYFLRRSLLSLSLSICLGLAAAGTGWAQTIGPTIAPGHDVEHSDSGQEVVVLDDEPIISVDVQLVNVMATVRDKDGKLIGDLGKDDFVLKEDGKEQQIRYFARQTDLPLTIGLLVDVSGSQANLIGVEQQAASSFFRNVLRDQDLAFLISFGADSELLQDITSSPSMLEDGLRDLRLNTGVAQMAGRPGPVPTMNRPAGTVLYDAIYLAASERLKREAGRKVIVVITDGVDQGSKLNRDDAIEAAHRSDAAIYGIYYTDYGYGFGASDRDLKKMAEATGGSVFKVNKPGDLEKIFSKIEEEMRSQYAIGYSPSNPVKDGSFRKIEIKTTDKHFKVQARNGYYATPPEP